MSSPSASLFADETFDPANLTATTFLPYVANICEELGLSVSIHTVWSNPACNVYLAVANRGPMDGLHFASTDIQTHLREGIERLLGDATASLNSDPHGIADVVYGVMEGSSWSVNFNAKSSGLEISPVTESEIVRLLHSHSIYKTPSGRSKIVFSRSGDRTLHQVLNDMVPAGYTHCHQPHRVRVEGEKAFYIPFTVRPYDPDHRGFDVSGDLARSIDRHWPISTLQPDNWRLIYPFWNSFERAVFGEYEVPTQSTSMEPIAVAKSSVILVTDSSAEIYDFDPEREKQIREERYPLDADPVHFMMITKPVTTKPATKA